MLVDPHFCNLGDEEYVYNQASVKENNSNHNDSEDDNINNNNNNNSINDKHNNNDYYKDSTINISIDQINNQEIFGAKKWQNKLFTERENEKIRSPRNTGLTFKTLISIIKYY